MEINKFPIYSPPSVQSVPTLFDVMYSHFFFFYFCVEAATTKIMVFQYYRTYVGPYTRGGKSS